MPQLAQVLQQKHTPGWDRECWKQLGVPGLGFRNSFRGGTGGLGMGGIPRRDCRGWM